MDDPERALLARLSVFAGSFDLVTVTEACVGGPIDTSQALDLLTPLVDRSVDAVVGTHGAVQRPRLGACGQSRSNRLPTSGG